MIDKQDLKNHPVNPVILSKLLIAQIEKIKAKAEKASALLGLKSLSEYIVRLIDDNASHVIAQYESITVEDDIFDRFMSACKEAQKPNKVLIK